MKRNEENKYKSFSKKKNIYSYGLEEEKDFKSMGGTQSKNQTESNHKETNESIINNVYKLFSDNTFDHGVMGTRGS